MTTFMPIVRDVLFFAIWFGVPILVLLPRMKKREDIGKRMVISTVATWVALVLHLELVHYPVGQAIARARGETGFDGGLMAGMIPFFGWVFGLIGTVAVVCFQFVVQRVRRRHHANVALTMRSS